MFYLAEWHLALQKLFWAVLSCRVPAIAPGAIHRQPNAFVLYLIKLNN